MELLIEAFLLGLIGGAVPGPILTSTFAEVLNTNFIKGMRVIFLALVIETVGAFLAIYVFYKLGLSNLLVQIISVCGAIVLFWLASKVWGIKKINSESKQILSFYQIVALTALNSGYWIFWITVGVPKALLLDNILMDGKIIFLIIFQTAWLVMTTLLAFIFYRSRPILEKRNLVGTTFKILAIILVLLGIKTLLTVL